MEMSLVVWFFFVIQWDLRFDYTKNHYNRRRPVNEMEANFPIAFGMLIYKQFDQFEQLFRILYRPYNFYCLHTVTAFRYQRNFDTFWKICSNLTWHTNMILAKYLSVKVLRDGEKSERERDDRDNWQWKKLKRAKTTVFARIFLYFTVLNPEVQWQPKECTRAQGMCPARALVPCRPSDHRVRWTGLIFCVLSYIPWEITVIIFFVLFVCRI